MASREPSLGLSKLHRRLDALREEALRAENAPTLLHRALAELHTCVEELRVTEEELFEQNAALVRANAELGRERQRYADLFEHAPVACAVTDPQGVLRELNRAAMSLLRQPAAELVGKPLALLVDAADRQRWRDLLGRLTAGELERGAERVRLGLGEHRVRVRIEGAVQRDDDNAAVAYLWILDGRDSTAEAERTSTESKRKDEFLAMLGHELRNPLAPIRAAVELWRHHASELTDAQRQWTVDVVSRQADHLAHLVDELLDVSRLTHGKIRLRRATVDIREIIEQARDVMRAQAQLHTVELVMPPVPMRVDGDAVRLRQVLVNLIDNALRFTPRGGRITVRANIESGRAVVVVADNGIGLLPEMRERVFGLLSEGEEALEQGADGLGLGLAVVRRLVELHGGSVSARSPGLGRGSEFEITLPMVIDASPTRVDRPPAARQAASLRLLLVDDNVDGAEMLGKLLETIGHVPTLVFDGASAIERFEDLRPDAVILDLGLPDIDGLEVARHMRARVPGVHLIALTGYGDDRIRARVREAGFADHLLKPVELDALRTALGRVTAR